MVIKLNGNEVYRNRVEVQQFNNLTDKVEFIFNKTVNDIDLSECVARIVVGDLDFMILGVHDNLTGKVEGDNFILEWMVGGADTLHDVMHDCQVSFTKSGKMLFKEPFTLNVLQSMPTDHPEYEPNLLEEYLAKYNETLDETKSARDEAVGTAAHVDDVAEIVNTDRISAQNSADASAMSEANALHYAQESEEAYQLAQSSAELSVDASESARESEERVAGLEGSVTASKEVVDAFHTDVINKANTVTQKATEVSANAQTVATDKATAESLKNQTLILKNDTQLLKQDTEKIKSDALSKVGSAVSSGVSTVNNAKTSAVSDIETAKTDAINEFNANANVQRITNLETGLTETNEDLSALDERVNVLEQGGSGGGTEGVDLVARNGVTELRGKVTELEENALTSVPKATGNTYGGIKALASQSDDNGVARIDANGYMHYHRTTTDEINNVINGSDLKTQVDEIERSALKEVPRATFTTYGGVKAYSSYDGDGDNSLARINDDGFVKYHKTTNSEILNVLNGSQVKTDVDTLKNTALTSIPKADGNNFGGVKASAQQDDHNGTVTISANGYLKYHRTTDSEITNLINNSNVATRLTTLEGSALKSVPKATGSVYGGIKASESQSDDNGVARIDENGYVRYHKTTNSEILNAIDGSQIKNDVDNLKYVTTPQMYKTASNTWTDAFNAMFADPKYRDYYIPPLVKKWKDQSGNDVYGIDSYPVTEPWTFNTKVNIMLSPKATVNFNFGNGSQATYCIKFDYVNKDRNAQYSKIEGGTISHQGDTHNIKEIINVNAFNVFIKDLTVRGDASVTTTHDIPTLDKGSVSREENGIHICYGTENAGKECRIYGCKIKGTQVGLLVENVDLFIENTYIEGCTGSGFKAYNYTNDSGTVVAQGRAIDAYHVHSFGNLGNGFYLIGAESCNFNNCYADTNGGDGYHLEGPSNSATPHNPNTFVACRSFKNRGQFGYYIKDQTYCTFYSCRSENEAFTKEYPSSWAFRATTGRSNNVNLIGCYNANNSKEISVGTGAGTNNIHGLWNAGGGKITDLNTLEEK